jgi:hypothetical protein
MIGEILFKEWVSRKPNIGSKCDLERRVRDCWLWRRAQGPCGIYRTLQCYNAHEASLATYPWWLGVGLVQLWDRCAGHHDARRATERLGKKSFDSFRGYQSGFSSSCHHLHATMKFFLHMTQKCVRHGVF